LRRWHFHGRPDVAAGALRVRDAELDDDEHSAENGQDRAADVTPSLRVWASLAPW